MTEMELLRPAKGHFFLVASAVICLISASVLSISTLYYTAVVGNRPLFLEQTGWGLLLWIVVLPLAVLPGRFVAFYGDSQVSQPTVFPRKSPKFIKGEDVKSYAQTTVARNGERIKIIVLETKAGKRIRFSEGKTPGCAARLIRLLERWHVPEDTGIL